MSAAIKVGTWQKDAAGRRYLYVGNILGTFACVWERSAAGEVTVTYLGGLGGDRRPPPIDFGTLAEALSYLGAT